MIDGPRFIQLRSIYLLERSYMDSLNTRSLKIEAAGDFFRGQVKPKIRITGNWLKQAGFSPGHRVQIIFIGPGIIELRSTPQLSE